MAGIRINGLASGLPPNLVDQVIEAERIPVKQMQDKKAKIEDKVKLVTDLETKVNDISKSLSTIMGRKGFVDKKFNSGFPDIINGTLDPEVAEPGEWTLEVMQLANKPSVVSNGFPDKDETRIGLGYITFNTAEGEKEVYINEDNSTLEKLAETINNSEVGVRATVVNDRSDKEDSYKIELSGNKTGDDNEVEFPVVYMLDGHRDFQFIENNKSKNAKFKLDGHEFETSSNMITDLLPGVTIDLKQAKPGMPIRVNVSENYDMISDKVKGFVDSYNAALAFIQGQNKLTTAEKGGNPTLGPLGGDGMLRMTEGRLRSIIQTAQFTESDITRVIELGIEFNRNGTLNFNQDKFKKILTADPMRVVKFLRGNLVDTGFIPQLNRGIKALTDPSMGMVGSRKKNYQNRANQIDERIERKEKSLEKREEQLRKQFARMEEAMSKIQSQGASLGAAVGKG